MNDLPSKAAIGSVASPGTDRTRGFWFLIVTQFQGAFSDNVLKNLVIFMLIGMNVSVAEKHKIGELVGALFSLPFILFSMAGGFLADRFSKRIITVNVKVFEVAVMAVALAGLLNGNLKILLACVLLMGVHSAFFGPSKYGLLPELLPEKKLSWGNGILELGTFTAIILGTVAAALMAQHFRGAQWISGGILIGLALAGLATSLGITRVPAADPAKKFHANFPAEVWAQIRVWRHDRPLLLAVAGNTYFNFLGALLLLNLFFYGADVLHVDETKIGLLNVALALGIGLGSVAAGYLSGGKIEYGLVPLGAFGLAIFSASLAVPNLSVNAALVRLALLGFAGGFFIVPISALLQHRPAKTAKGATLAAANLLSFVGIFLASGAHWLLAQGLSLSPGTIFLFGGALTLVGGLYAMFLLPDALLRFGLWCATHSFYRVRVNGRDNIPAKGGALFVCNHVSFVDALLLIAATDRHVRFMMLKSYYELPYVKPFARALGVIPISSEQRPRDLLKSLQTASDAIKDGHVVCIFAEGQITRIGQLLPFRRGLERIMKEVDAPIVPIALDGVWGSLFSFEKRRFIWKMPHRIPHPVTVSFGLPMSAHATAFEVRQAVQELQASAWHDRRDRMQPLHRAFVKMARRVPLRLAMVGAQTPALSFGGALVRTVLLARRLRKVWAGQKMVGLLLPPSVPGALVNFAALLSGKVPVNLNYTLSEEALASCVKQCEIKTVLTSRAFLEKVKLKVPGEVVYLEDVLGSRPTTDEPLTPALSPPDGERVAAGRVRGRPPSAMEKLTAFLMAWFLPVGWLERALGNCRGRRKGSLTSPPKSNSETPHGVSYEAEDPLDDLATVIFSSGSTGEPKGVMLSHYNIGSNIEQMGQVFAFQRNDRVLGVLPFFHSLGFTGTLMLPSVLGLGAAYHANPLDAKTIGPLVCDHNVTFLLATPTFLQLYMRGCTPEQFGSVRLVAVGAEKLPDRVAAAFDEQFGIRPFEAYGCTECAPAVTVNTHDFRAAGFRQVGAKRGKIGHPLPGVCVRIVDPETRAPVPTGQPGLLLVHGPNIMLGYLGKPEKTAEVLIDDPSPGLRPPSPHPMGRGQGEGRGDSSAKWYVTGDVATLDEDGFLQITDRLSRFSKIGGEMVPHIKVEEILHELAGVTEQTFVVTSVADEKKGERLVVLHKLAADKLPACLEKLATSDLPNLWKPKADAFVRLDAFPMLGTGKLDLRKVKETAQKASTTNESA